MSAETVSTLVADEWTLIAYHEAGHAVAGEAQCHNTRRVSVAPRRETGGRVRFVPLEARPRQEAIQAYAGHAAVVALLGQGSMTEASAAAFGASVDFAKASALLDGFQRKSAKAEAIRLVRHYRPAIERLVQLLQVHTRVDGEVVAVLVDWQDEGVDAEPFLSYWTERKQNEHLRDDTSSEGGLETEPLYRGVISGLVKLVLLGGALLAVLDILYELLWRS